MTKMKIAIFCGGPSSEHEVSLLSSKNIYEYIDRAKYSVHFFYITKDLQCRFAKDVHQLNSTSESAIPFLEGLSKIKSDNSFALLAGLHGEFVEDGQIQTLLSYFNIPYLGSGPAASALAMDKYRTSQLVNTLKNVNIPKTFLVKDPENFPKTLSFPVIIKPNTMGSSIGISVVKTLRDYKTKVEKLKKTYPSQEIVLQQYLEDAIEIQCGVLQKSDGKFIQLPPIEIIPQKNFFFDYESKYAPGGATEITPPVSISKKLSDIISQLAIDIHTLLGLKTYSRSDFLIKKNKVYFLETNTLPGMTSTSLLPQEAAAAGISFSQLLDFLISNTSS